MGPKYNKCARPESHRCNNRGAHVTVFICCPILEYINVLFLSRTFLNRVAGPWGVKGLSYSGVVDRVNDDLGRQGAPGISLGEIGWCRCCVKGNGDGIVHNIDIIVWSCSPVQGPFDLARVTDVDVPIDDDGKFFQRWIDGPGSPDQLPELSGIKLVHEDNHICSGAATFGNVDVLDRQEETIFDVRIDS